jgi:hypothetical protein
LQAATKGSRSRPAFPILAQAGPRLPYTSSIWKAHYVTRRATHQSHDPLSLPLLVQIAFLSSACCQSPIV